MKVGPLYVNPETHETEACLLCRSLVDTAFPDLTCRHPEKAGIPVEPAGRCEFFRSVTRPEEPENPNEPQEG